MQENQSLTTAGFPQLSFPEHEQLRCPRCDSSNTKFCYYNNYNLSQPRHFCKNCRRYWTKGGTLRNIPVGGGCRKNNKRPAAAAAASIPSKQQQQHHRVVQNPSASNVTSSGTGSGSGSQNLGLKPEPGLTLGEDVGKESFTSLLGLASNGQFGNFLEGFGQNGVKFGSINRSGQNMSLEGLQGSGISSEGFMISEVQNGSEPNCWASNNYGWPNLAINNTPGSKLQ